MGVLNHEQILGRLGRGEIFVGHSWKKDQLRPAGYDLRISPKILALNNRVFDDDEDVGDLLKLHPGDAAYVQTVEIFCMPWDLVANLGLRFGYARQGLSVLTGLLVDPGFGQESNGDDWRSVGAPLQFFLVNVGAEDIQIKVGPRGDGVLSLQLLETTSPSEKKETIPQARVEPSAALWAFQGSEQFQRDLKQQKVATEQQFRDMKEEIKELRAKVETTESATSNIVVFGVFLLAITLAGVIISLLLDYLSGDAFGRLVRNLDHLHLQGAPATLLAIAGLMVVLFPVLAVLFVFVRGLLTIHERISASQGQ
jgi:deoxycytidine triphosphate deaminase